MVSWADPWPRPADVAAAELFQERFAALGRAEARLARGARGRAALAALGGNSPFLAEMALREPTTLRAVLAYGPDRTFGQILERMALRERHTTAEGVGAILRRAKRRVALCVALADIGGAWPLEVVTGALSRFAEEALGLATRQMLREAARRGDLAVPDLAHPEQGSGFVVLGMGKLGARELNYSSDIDLVLIYDPAPHVRAGIDAETLASGFARVARGLVHLMQARDADGYVFRTDLRLRPDPGATPPAISLPAALTYYESLAQNWERAAMLKARPVAGDIPVGAAFLEAIRPFIWRKGLDFAAIADIAAMKRRMDARSGSDPAGHDAKALAGFNVKLGRGGIREIEFLTQTLQLVWGGRDPSLRLPQTLTALRGLARAGHLPRAALRELTNAYSALRLIEHRLQMVEDRQTHCLPPSVAALDQFAVFLGLPDAQTLARGLATHLAAVRRRYRAVFDIIPGSGGSELDFTDPDARPMVLARLTELGFTDPDTIATSVAAWYAGRVRALRSDRARALIAEVLPPLLSALTRQPQPDAAFARFDRLLARLPAGVPMLSLLGRNPAALDRVANVLGAAPFLAEHLAQNPAALDGLLMPDRLPSPRRLLRERLATATTLEEAVGVMRRVRAEIDFSLSVATLEGRLDADAAGLARTALAEAVVEALLPRVMADIARRHGPVPGGGLVVVALGKAGAREMMAGSDLDLMLIYDHPPDITESRPGREGGRAVPAPQYFARAAQAFISALTAPGAEGPIFAVDMRLRPSGSAGPVAVSLAAFRRYHREQAWTWERMAITRARVIAGPPILSARVSDACLTVIEYAGLNPDLAADAAAMRARLSRERPGHGPWDVKHRGGGLMEVAFIAEILQLRHAGAHPGLAHPTTREALQRLNANGLLTEADTETLSRADLLWRTVQGLLRVTVGDLREAALPAATAEVLLHALAWTHVATEAELHRLMDDTAQAVRDAFTRLVAPLPDPIRETTE